jgi:hypothetical protein
MAKSLDNSVLDAALNEVATATEQYLCVGAPVSRADAISKSQIPAATPSFQAIADAAGGGRELETDASNGNTVDGGGGTVDHVALCDASTLLLVTSLASGTAVSDGMTVNISSFTTVIADPT